MFAKIARLSALGSVPFLAAKCFSSPQPFSTETHKLGQQPLTPPTTVSPRSKVAIIGAGVGGCTAAFYLREHSGSDLDIRVFSQDGRVGGRTAVIEMEGHLYESGASIIHTSNKYLMDFADQFGLDTVCNKDLPATPMGIFDGEKFVFRLWSCGICNTVKILWRYGISAIRLNSHVKSTVRKFSRIYKLQSDGHVFTTVPEMLSAMGGEEMYELTQISAQEYFVGKLGWSQRMVDELVTAALRTSYNQNTNANAFTALIALAGVEAGSLWYVVGGNYLIPKKALEASGAQLCKATVLSVSRDQSDENISYTVQYRDESTSGVSSEKFDAVIVAHPLNVSEVKFINFLKPIYSQAATSPFHRTVVTFVKGELHPAFFDLEQYGKDFPVDIFTTAAAANGAVNICSIGLQIPSEATKAQVKDYLQSVGENPLRIWKIFSPTPLTEAEKNKIFTKREGVEVTVDWLAYPEYNPPEECPPFILDDGVFYNNGIEKASSAMEMSTIGAVNAALLAAKFLK